MERPLTVTSPDKSPPVKFGTRPLIKPKSVDFPEPVFPTTKASSPAGIVRFTFSRIGKFEPLYLKVTFSNLIMQHFFQDVYLL